MTLTDIGRMMRLARVERSKTVECAYPNPSTTIYVPAVNFLTVADVVARVKLAHENITVLLLDRRMHNDVRTGEHVCVKVKGEIAPPGKPYDDAFMPETFYRRARIRTARARNAAVVVECASVVIT
jgi:hypothetical protein